MLVLVYKLCGHVTRSVARARLVAEVQVDEIPDDQVSFAMEYGGDFIEIVWDEVVRDEELALA